MGADRREGLQRQQDRRTSSWALLGPKSVRPGERQTDRVLGRWAWRWRWPQGAFQSEAHPGEALRWLCPGASLTSVPALCPPQTPSDLLMALPGDRPSARRSQGRAGGLASKCLVVCGPAPFSTCSRCSSEPGPPSRPHLPRCSNRMKPERAPAPPPDGRDPQEEETRECPVPT